MTLTEKRAKLITALANTTDKHRREELTRYLGQVNAALAKKPTGTKNTDMLLRAIVLIAMLPAGVVGAMALINGRFTAYSLVMAIIVSSVMWAVASLTLSLSAWAMVLIIAAGVERGNSNG